MNEKYKKAIIIAATTPFLAASILAIGFYGANKTPINEEIALDNTREIVEELTFEYGERVEGKKITVTNENGTKEIDIERLEPKINVMRVGDYSHTANVDGEKYTVDIKVNDTKLPEFEEYPNGIYIKGYKMSEEEIKNELKKMIYAKDEVDGSVPVEIKLVAKNTSSYDAIFTATDSNGNETTKKHNVTITRDKQKEKEARKNMTSDEIKAEKEAQKEMSKQIQKNYREGLEEKGDVTREKQAEREKRQREEESLSNQNDEVKDPTPSINPELPPAPESNVANSNNNHSLPSDWDQEEFDANNPYNVDISMAPEFARDVKKSFIPWATLKENAPTRLTYTANKHVFGDYKIIEISIDDKRVVRSKVSNGEKTVLFNHTLGTNKYAYIMHDKVFDEKDQDKLILALRVFGYYHSKTKF